MLTIVCLVFQLKRNSVLGRFVSLSTLIWTFLEFSISIEDHSNISHDEMYSMFSMARNWLWYQSTVNYVLIFLSMASNKRDLHQWCSLRSSSFKGFHSRIHQMDVYCWKWTLPEMFQAIIFSFESRRVRYVVLQASGIQYIVTAYIVMNK